MLVSIKITTKTPNIRDFCHNISKFERFHAEYTENSGYSIGFFRKIGKFALIGIKLTTYLTIWVENSEKSEFSLKQVRILALYFYKTTVCGYISAQLSKQSFFPHKNKVEKSHNLKLTKYPLIIVENTKNLTNPSYTIEYKLVRNSHLLSQKLAFSQVPQQLFNKQTQIAHTQNSQSSN